MPAEGMPPETVLGRMLKALVRLAIFKPKLTIAIGLLGMIVSSYLCATQLKYHTSRAALLDQREEYHKRWLSYVEEFGEQEDVVVVVQGESREALIPVLDAVVRDVSAQSKYFNSVLHEIDLTKFGLYLPTKEELLKIDGFVGDVEPIIRGGWDYLTPGTMAEGMNAQLQFARPEQFPKALAEAQVRLTQMGESLLTALSSPGVYKSPWTELSNSTSTLMGLSSQRMIIADNKIGLVLLKLNKDESKSFIQNTESIAVLRKTIAKIQSESQGVKIGLTGLPILEHDEMESSESSMTVATILSFVGVFLVLVAGFGSVRHSLMAMASLLIGLVCSLGYTVLAVGHLNILSSAFGAILIGLGINYGIYFIASYLKFREKGIALDDALVDTAACVGPGIAISSLSTAMAFLAAGFTEFTGVAEMGRIAGGGIILCLAAAFLMLPAIIKLCDSWKTDWRMPEPLNFDRWLAPVIARPWFAIVAVTVLTGILALGLGRLRYDYNLLSLQPAGLESVELEKKLLAETHESVYFALSMAKTPAEAAILKEKFLKLPTVERVEEIATRFTDGAEKSQIIDRIRSRLAGLPERAPQIRVAPPYELSQKISAAQQLVAANVRVAKFQQQFQEIQSLLGQLPQEEYYKRLSEYQQRVAGELLQWLHVLQAVTNAQPPTPADLPQGLVSRFIGSKGSHLLRIYVKGDFWNIDNMRKFVENVRSVDPNVTGNPVQIYEASRQMRLSYERAAVFALMAIIPVLALNFGTLSAIFLAIIPLIADLLQTFGIMGLLDMPLNSANMIGLSLMLGMGMENGILITQDYLCQKGRYRMSGSTGVAVVLNTLTTMVGFAVLMLAAHRGLQSLGRMLAIGMGCSMISALLILPTLMTWLTRNRKEEISETPEEEIGQEIENVTRHDGSLDLETHFPDDELPAHSYRRMDRQHPTLSGTHRPPRTADWTTTSETETDEKTSMYGGA